MAQTDWLCSECSRRHPTVEAAAACDCAGATAKRDVVAAGRERVRAWRASMSPEQRKELRERGRQRRIEREAAARGMTAEELVAARGARQQRASERQQRRERSRDGAVPMLTDHERGELERLMGGPDWYPRCAGGTGRYINDDESLTAEGAAEVERRKQAVRAGRDPDTGEPRGELANIGPVEALVAAEQKILEAA